MKYMALALLTITCLPVMAFAGDHCRFGFFFGFGGPGFFFSDHHVAVDVCPPPPYCAPPVAVVAPPTYCPPPVVYCPPPVVYTPAPQVYYVPAYAPGYYAPRVYYHIEGRGYYRR